MGDGGVSLHPTSPSLRPATPTTTTTLHCPPTANTPPSPTCTPFLVGHAHRPPTPTHPHTTHPPQPHLHALLGGARRLCARIRAWVGARVGW